MRRQLPALAALLLLLIVLTAPAGAHHSHPYFYDACKSVTIQGRIERIDFKDPHSLIIVRADDGSEYTVDWAGLRGLTITGVVTSARQALVSGTRVVVTGNRIRSLAEIQQHFPEYNTPVNPNVLDPTAIRGGGDAFNWTRAQSGNPPSCGK